MAEGKSGRFWTLFIVLLALIIIAGGIAAWSRYSPGEPVEISFPEDEKWQGTVYIGGAVNLPGYYPFSYEDDIESLIRAAGGTTGSADLSGLVLQIPETGEGQEGQKIDINRADVWLIEALPGIGEVLAQRISDYRAQNGPFLNIIELMEVDGIGTAIYEKIEHLNTVAD